LPLTSNGIRVGDRHADALGDLADDVEIEADRLVLVVERAERRRIELHAGDQLTSRLDLGDGILRLGIRA
jgi:hypothetical protein